MRIVCSRRGVSGAVSAMFVIAIFFIITISLFVYTLQLHEYNQIVNERDTMDWERMNEKIVIPWTAMNNTPGILNITVTNIGGVTAHLVQMWLTELNYQAEAKWQTEYLIDTYISPGETIPDYGYDGRFIRIGGDGTARLMTSLSNLNSSSYYRIKLVTERGNVAIGEYPPRVYREGGGDGEGTLGGYVLQIESAEAHFEYAFNTMTTWSSALIKIRHNDPPIMYRVLIRNTTPKNIRLLRDSCMLQIGTGQIGTSRRWFICQPDPTGTSYLPLNPTLWRPKDTPPPPEFISQTIPGQSVRYLYFAIVPDDTWEHPGNDWQTDPPYSSQQFSLMSCMLWFTYEGETEVRNVPTPVLVQVLNPD